MSYFFFFVSAGVFNVDASHLEMTICPRHRDLFGLRWESERSICTIPDKIAARISSSAKGLCGLRSNQSECIYLKTQQLVPTGSRKSHGLKY